jgi:guanylate kinase
MQRSPLKPVEDTGQIFVIAGPSGVGKAPLIRHLLKDKSYQPKFVKPCSTGRPEPGESDGLYRYFLNDQAFDDMLTEGKFLQWTMVKGYRQGIAKYEIEGKLSCSEKDLIIDTSVGGALELRNHPHARLRDHVSIFILPPTSAVMAGHLRELCGGNAAASGILLERALADLSEAHKFDHHLVTSDDVEADVMKLKDILERRKKAYTPEPVLQVLRAGGIPNSYTELLSRAA